jgi:SAM-dependent methyltransferase
VDQSDIQVHVAGAPLYRRPIAAEVTKFARMLPPDARVLDAGAGIAPYRKLFSHCTYTTADWPSSMHAGQIDIETDLHDLPIAAESFDAVVCTEVLEHVRHPERVAAELNRVLTPNGRLLVTVPFVIELHEEPFDYSRFTSYGLEATLAAGGFDEIEVRPLTGAFSVLAVVLRIALGLGILEGTRSRIGYAIGWRLCRALVALFESAAHRLDSRDKRRVLPLGWVALARATA